MHENIKKLDTYMPTTPKSIFISYSGNDVTASFFAEIVDSIVRNKGLVPVRYQEQGGAAFANISENFAMSSLKYVDRCDAVISLFSPHYYGSAPAPGSCDGADGRKSLCWLEAERAWSHGKDVLSFVPMAGWPEADQLPPELLSEVMKGRQRLIEKYSDSIHSLSAFKSRLKEQGSITEFGAVENFRRQVARVLDEWLHTRLMVFDLFESNSKTLFGRNEDLEKLVERMQIPGTLGVIGAWGIGKSALVSQAARLMANQSVYRRIVSVDWPKSLRCGCRNRDLRALSICR